MSHSVTTVWFSSKPPLAPLSPHLTALFFLFFKDFIYLFSEREKGGREGEKHPCVRDTATGCLLHTPPTGDLACNPGMYPDGESNLWPFGSQAGAQSTEPHQPGQLAPSWQDHQWRQRRPVLLPYEFDSWAKHIVAPRVQDKIASYLDLPWLRPWQRPVKELFPFPLILLTFHVYSFLA